MLLVVVIVNLVLPIPSVLLVMMFFILLLMLVQLVMADVKLVVQVLQPTVFLVLLELVKI